jgi:hypothetical protein
MNSVSIDSPLRIFFLIFYLKISNDGNTKTWVKILVPHNTGVLKITLLGSDYEYEESIELIECMTKLSFVCKV